MGGYFHGEEAIAVAERLPNVVLESSAMPYPARSERRSSASARTRVLYASDGPACSPRIEIEKVRLAGLDPEAERLVFAGQRAAACSRRFDDRRPR